MLFFDKQSQEQQDYYLRMMGYIASLSRLFSDSDTPYYHYRASENLFCRAFEARNLSRSDVSADASKDRIGVGIKTFLEKNGSSFEKVAEFSSVNKDLETDKLIYDIARQRNERLRATKNLFQLDNLIYHCVVRSNGYMKVYETDFSAIDLDNIRISKKGNDNNVWFSDKVNEYKFTLSKSTLYRRFHSPDNRGDYRQIDININADPFAILETLFGEADFGATQTQEQPFVILPLYSDKRQDVMLKSGLNAWNAGGRKRDDDEVYIPIPIEVRRTFPDFFPERYTTFDLEKPDGSVISVKVTQDEGKALTSNPLKELGKWLLRDVLELARGEVVTMATLQDIGLDSVIIHKESDTRYTINFKEVGSYEEFKADYLSEES